MSFVHALAERVAGGSWRVGFPEAREVRTREAIRRLSAEGRIRPVVVEWLDEVADLLDDLPTLELLDPSDLEVRESTRTYLPKSLQGRVDDPLLASVALLKEGRLDGVVAGAHNPTAEVVRAGLKVLGTADGIETVSGSFYMVVPPLEGQPEEVLTFTDAAVVPYPSAAQLADSAEAACRARRLVVGDEPRVAFLSYSTYGSAGGESVTRVRNALGLFRSRCPDVVCDGELQVDAALNPEVAERKAPGSPVRGRANILVFPDLNAANIGYKLVRRLGGARALGPVLQGLARPLNDLSRGAAIDDIVHVSYITALMARPDPALDGASQPAGE
jgi:phosphate acetyltransferase